MSAIPIQAQQISRLFLRCLLACGLAFGGAPAAHAQATPADIQSFTRENYTMCREAGGTPRTLDEYLTEVGDINGDGAPDYVTDLAGLECANAWSYFCGSAGCPVSVWLSRPQGYKPEWSGHARGWRRQGTAIVISLHGQLCNPPRVGSQGCEVAMHFNQAPASRGSSAPAETQTGLSGVTPTTVEGWQLRRAPGGNAIAQVSGAGTLTTLSALCLRDRPVMMAALSEAAGARTATFPFGFADRSIEVTGLAGTPTQKTYILDPRADGLAAALSGGEVSVSFRIEGRDQGKLSLQGSSQALREALSPCMAF
ncbi:MAG: hypothetical protein P1U62_08965 [Alteraurantiacibacter sp. bin_em_oilr2.035]|nr:hypothetical protein [Alteraurantiacibacter sp. bin_em_oilr2.035]